MQLERALLAGKAALGEPRALPGGGGELLVAAPAAAATGDDGALAGFHQVPAVARLDVLDGRPGRHAHFERVGRGAVPVRPLAMTAPLRSELRAAAEAGQVAQRRVHDEDDVAAAPAVAAVGTALGNVRLAPERDRAVAAGTAPHVDTRAVVEHG